MNVAVIPARGGSKRIPRKNIKTFCGKPMIAWSIEAALKSGCFERVIVSTDDEEIADVAQQYGAEAPFIRPADLSNDFANTAPVIKHAIEWLFSQDINPEFVCCIYATAPFLQADDLVKGLDRFANEPCDFVFSVASFAYPVQRALKLTTDGRVQMFFPKFMKTRSQDLEEGFHDAGQFYWGRVDAWTEERPIFGCDSIPLFLSRHRVQDIDTPEDWLQAELMFSALNLMEETIHP